MTSPDLICPSCGLEHGQGDRSFCSRCGMPLVEPGGEPLDEPLSEAHGRARKIDPRYTEGRLVRVAGGRNQAEAEFIQGMLLEEGIPSMLRRSAGFDVPDYLAAGPRDVLVPEAATEAAHELLHQTDLAPAAGEASRPSLVKLIAVIGIGCGAVVLLAWLLQGGG